MSLINKHGDWGCLIGRVSDMFRISLLFVLYVWERRDFYQNIYGNGHMYELVTFSEKPSLRSKIFSLHFPSTFCFLFHPSPESPRLKFMDLPLVTEEYNCILIRSVRNEDYCRLQTEWRKQI